MDLGKAVGNVAAVGFGLAGVADFLVAIPILLVAVGFLYILSLYLVRVVQLVFAVASAPIFVALGVYDQRNRFVHWWLDLYTSATVLPTKATPWLASSSAWAEPSVFAAAMPSGTVVMM